MQITQSSTLNNIADAAYLLAKEKGWHDEDETEDHFIERACNNMHDEVSELHEAWRNNRLHKDCDKAEKMAAEGLPVLTCLQEEYADIVIRAAENSKRLGFDLQLAVAIKHEFNKTRPVRHGGKKS